MSSIPWEVQIGIGAFFGQATFINPPAGSAAFLVIAADNVLIQNLNIKGGAIGVQIARGSNVQVINNRIDDSTSFGITMSGASYAFISGNVLNSVSDNF